VTFAADDPDMILPHELRCWSSEQLKYSSERPHCYTNVRSRREFDGGFRVTRMSARGRLRLFVTVRS
jgi:hypothetical protein